MTWTSALMRSWYGIIQHWFFDCFLGYPMLQVNTLWTGDTDLRLYITTVQDG